MAEKITIRSTSEKNVLMYVEFDLTDVYYPTLEQEIQSWSQQYSVKYYLKIHKHKAKLTFVDEKNYSTFCMSWNPTLSDYLKYTIIEPMKVDKTK
jgi:hypothetical protein